MNSGSTRSSRTPKLGLLDTSFGSDDSTPELESLGTGPLFITITEYSKRMEDELDMKPGDKIQVITDDEEYNDGWYYGRNLRTNEEGLYPKVFTQEISQPSLVRAKSAKRVASPLANGSTTNLSTLSYDGSTSELATPQPLETAAPVKLNGSNRHPVTVDRSASVKVTMSDIDKALEEFRGDSGVDLSQPATEEVTTNTTFSTVTTTDGEMSRGKLRGSTSAHSLTNDTSFRTSSINGIDTHELKPANAKNWTPEQVTAYFIGSGFDVESSTRFQQHKISGSILLELELAHLKELDINSFGIRFEIFKEIEAIKDIISTQGPARLPSQLMPAAAVNQRSYMGHARKTSQSLEDLPTKSLAPPKTQSTRHRPYSLVIQDKDSALTAVEAATGAQEPKSSSRDSKSYDKNFLSPRRAPKPPSYPSPVQPPRSPTVQTHTPSPQTAQYPQNYKNAPPTIYERAPQLESRPNNTAETHTPRFQFPKTTPPQILSDTPEGDEDSEYNESSEASNQIPETTAGNRNSLFLPNQQQNHRKSRSGGSFVELFNRIAMMSPSVSKSTQDDVEGLNVPDSQSMRPTSSVYEHSRTASPSHIRHPSQLNSDVKKHRRNSSILSFFSNKGEENGKSSSPTRKSHSRKASVSHSRKNSALGYNNSSPFSPERVKSPNKRNSIVVSPLVAPVSPVTEDTETSNKRRSVSAKEPSTNLAAKDSDLFYDAKDDTLEDVKNKRSVSEVKPKALRTKSSKNLPRKMQTSAFVEGIRTISVQTAMTESDCSGWMSKKGSGAMGVWKNRFFTLHGTRLSYFANTTDTRERGLIDITAHRVLPAKEDDKLVALYAASTGKGRYCFKLLPPQPGSKKGLTFTQPRVHYFAVDTKEEMRAWMAALIKATIDIDTSVPIISSCATPTVSLNKAQEMLTQAREETRVREEQRYLNEEDEDQLLWEQQQRAESNSQEGTTENSTPNSSLQQNTSVGSGFHSPYLLASGVLSPGVTHNSGRFPEQQGSDYFLLGSKYANTKI